MQNYDVIIAGAGPAGLSIARELAPSGLKVLLLDTKPKAESLKYYTCGSFIDPELYGIPKDVLNPLSQSAFCSTNCQVVKKGIAYIVDKRKLLRFLEAEAKKNQNCTIKYGTGIRKVIANRDGVDHLMLDSGNEVKAKVYVDCTGIARAICKKVGIKPLKQYVAFGIEYLVKLKGDSHTADLFVGSRLKGGYGWLFPLNSKQAIVGFGTLDKEDFGDAEPRLKAMWQIQRVNQRSSPKPLEKHKGVSITGIQRHIAEKNVICIGDSALQATPIVGEGIRPIMEASRLAAKSVVDAVKNNDLGLLKNYQDSWSKRYYSKYFYSTVTQRLLRRWSTDDSIMDRGTRRLGKLSDEDCNKLIKGDITLGLIVKSLLK